MCFRQWAKPCKYTPMLRLIIDANAPVMKQKKEKFSNYNYSHSCIILSTWLDIC